MGLAVQMLGWPEEFCNQLADAGFHVVRFDNRDVGHSTHVPGAPPTVRQLLTRSRRAAHYTLADMAEDAAGLLRELELAPAHVIGASMGGMIAQTLAARHPELVRSLVSIMSTTGQLDQRPALAATVPAVPEAPGRRPGGVRGAHGKGLHHDRLAGIPARSGGDPHARARELRTRPRPPRAPAVSWRRSSPRATERRNCIGIRAPTLVIHGSADRLVGPSGRTGHRARDPRLVADDGQGHGPRPAARDLAAPDRRDRPARPPRRRQRRELPTPTGPPAVSSGPVGVGSPRALSPGLP